METRLWALLCLLTVAVVGFCLRPAKDINLQLLSGTRALRGASNAWPLVGSSKFLQLTDIHFDPFYLPNGQMLPPPSTLLQYTSGPFCRLPPDNQSVPLPYSPYGRFGCDTPLPLLRNTLRYLSSGSVPDVDFVLVTGDIAAHMMNSSEQALAVVARARDELHRVYPPRTVRTFWVIGNNDVWPDYQITSEADNPYLVRLAKVWIDSLYYGDMRGGNALETFLAGGYYSVDLDARPVGVQLRPLSSPLTLIVLNTIYYASSNVVVNETMEEDPVGQLAWLNATLARADRRGRKVLLTGHLPPGVSSHALRLWKRRYELAFREIVLAHAHVITASVWGHVHRAEMRLMHKSCPGDSGNGTDTGEDNYNRDSISTGHDGDQREGQRTGHERDDSGYMTRGVKGAGEQGSHRGGDQYNYMRTGHVPEQTAARGDKADGGILGRARGGDEHEEGVVGHRRGRSGGAMSALLLGPAITPVYNNFPGFRVITLDAEGDVRDFTDYHAPLTNSSAAPRWSVSYAASSTYNLAAPMNTFEWERAVHHVFGQWDACNGSRNAARGAQLDRDLPGARAVVSTPSTSDRRSLLASEQGKPSAVGLSSPGSTESNAHMFVEYCKWRENGNNWESPPDECCLSCPERIQCDVMNAAYDDFLACMGPDYPPPAPPPPPVNVTESTGSRT